MAHSLRLADPVLLDRISTPRGLMRETPVVRCLALSPLTNFLGVGA